jgi:voltage-gated potassium channel
MLTALRRVLLGLSRPAVLTAALTPEAALREERLRRFVRWSEWPLALLALAIIPSMLLDEYEPGAAVHRWSEVLNWVVWLVFCAEVAVKAWLSHDAKHFFRHAWFDLLIIVLSPPFLGPEYLQGIRAVRVARATRVLRALRLLRVLAVAGIAVESAKDALQHRKFHYVVIVTTVVLSIGALAIYGAEHGRNPNIKSIGDAFWWSIVTATTVGYGDISPSTTEGKLIAVVLMLVGIGFISIFTATIASFFLDQGKEEQAKEFAVLHERLARLELKQDQLLQVVTRQTGEPL